MDQNEIHEVLRRCSPSELAELEEELFEDYFFGNSDRLEWFIVFTYIKRRKKDKEYMDGHRF